MKKGVLHTELISTTERLREIQSPWEELLSHSAAEDFFLTPQWIFAWWAVHGQGKILLCVALWKQEELLGLFPLYAFRRGPFRVITFIGQPGLADRMDFILRQEHEDECLSAFTEWLSGTGDWDLLSLPSLGLFTDYPEKLYDHFKRKGMKSLLHPDAVCYFIRTADFSGYDDYLNKTRGKKSLKTIRRNRRKLDDAGDIEWMVVDRMTNELLDEAAEIDTRRSIRGRKKKSFFQDLLNRTFLKKLADDMGDTIRMEMIVCRIGGRLCSYELYFNYHQKFLSYQSAFDQEYAACSLGVITQLEAIKHAFGRQYKEYDFLIGDEGYKSLWSDIFRRARNLRVYSGSCRSRCLYMYDVVARPVLRAVKRALMGKKARTSIRREEQETSDG